MDSYDWFKNLVRDRRKLGDAGLEKVSDGRIFTGRQALDLRLVDELGNEKTAIAYLAREKQIPVTTPVRDYNLRSRLTDFPFLHVAAVAILDGAGLSGLARQLEASGAWTAAERLNLDGLLALWHPVTGD